MAVTSIWRVNGRLGNVVVYIGNPDKTDNPAFCDPQEQQGLEDVIHYAVNSQKTQKVDNERTELLHRFVSGVNCHPSTARDEMLAVKRRFGKEDGTVARTVHDAAIRRSRRMSVPRIRLPRRRMIKCPPPML